MDDKILEITFTTGLSVIFLCGYVLLYRKYRKTNHKIILLLALFYLCCTFESFFQDVESIADYITNGWIGWYYFIGKWMIVFRTLIIIAIFEFMARDSIRKGFIVYWALLSGVVVVLDFIWMYIETHFIDIPQFYYVRMLVDKPSDVAYYLLIMTIFFGVNIAFQIRKNAPISLKKPSHLFSIGFILTGVALAFFESDRLFSGVPFEVRYIAAAFIGLGVVIISVVLAKNPRIAYVLPFRLLRLSVLDMKSGNAYYNHTWEAGKGFVDENLFTGMLQGIRCIIYESMNQGDLKELKTESATILINKQKDIPVLFFLTTTAPTQILRSVLNTFAREFCVQFAKLFGSTVVSTDDFRTADSLVEKFFPFS